MFDQDIFVRLFASGNIRLACVAHKLQLDIKDGLKDCIALENVVEYIAKCVKISYKISYIL